MNLNCLLVVPQVNIRIVGAANWTIPLAYANNVINNTAIYAFEINATAPCVANPVITF